MDRDEILKKSREENKNRDFVEAEVLNRANAIALAVGVMVCGVVSILRISTLSMLASRSPKPSVFFAVASIYRASFIRSM